MLAIIATAKIPAVTRSTIRRHPTVVFIESSPQPGSDERVIDDLVKLPRNPREMSSGGGASGSMAIRCSTWCWRSSLAEGRAGHAPRQPAELLDRRIPLMPEIARTIRILSSAALMSLACSSTVLGQAAALAPEQDAI